MCKTPLFEIRDKGERQKMARECFKCTMETPMGKILNGYFYYEKDREKLMNKKEKSWSEERALGRLGLIARLGKPFYGLDHASYVAGFLPLYEKIPAKIKVWKRKLQGMGDPYGFLP